MISFTIIILISLSGIGLVTLLGYPNIKNFQESQIIKEGENNMINLNNNIREIASEAPGSIKKTKIKISGGNYRIYESNNTFEYKFKIESDIFPINSSIKKGVLEENIIGTESEKYFQIKIQYDDIKIYGKNNLEIYRGLNTICFIKVNENSTTSFINITLC